MEVVAMTVLEVQDETRRRLEEIPARLRGEFPAAPTAQVQLEVDRTAKRLLADATIEEYVPLFVHRFAREHFAQREEMDRLAA
jgi:hypothetical protein